MYLRNMSAAFLFALASASTPSAAAPIVARYNFDQAGSPSQISTTVIDDVGGNNGLVFGGGLNLVSGVTGNAARFDGVDDYFAITPTSSFQNAGYAVSFWIRSFVPQNNGPGSAGFVVSGTYNNNSDTSGGGYDIWLYEDDRIGNSQFTNPTGNFGGFSQNSLSLGDWHHVVVGWDGSQVAIYVDGGPSGGGTVSFTGGPSGGVRWADLPVNHTIYVGAYDGRQPSEPFQGFYLEGDLDELTFFQGSLSAEEVLALYNSGNSGVPVPASALIFVTGLLYLARMQARRNREIRAQD